MSTAFERALAFAALAAVPVFFASNVVIGRAAAESVGPWTLAFLRWAVAAAILAPFAGRELGRVVRAIGAEPGTYLALAGTGISICAGLFYVALTMTTATHGALIYTTSPLMVIVLERLFRGRRISGLEVTGILVAGVGVAVIVLRATAGTPTTLTMVVGDLLALFCAFAWAVYSVLLRRPEIASQPVIRVFLVNAVLGALLLLPMSAIEIATTGRVPVTLEAWAAIGGVALFASVLAFLAYQYAVRVVGPATTSLTIFLMPIAAVALAVAFLGEEIGPSVILGSALVFAGIVLARVRLRRRAA